ncbi:hypothetical protein PIB30_098708 [Stylosanthes scabra]|uniref:CCHC-type domain-containing protein n=1 Tax=Stylosanthes scabra TaxID=79078 RepID=A0ABU6YUA3_9FABA|nr:hypothetical protein [Stylosanthes scabra]
MRRKKNGRPVSTRIRNEMDMVERAKKRCSMCRQEGHTRRGCPNAPQGDPWSPRLGLHPVLDDGADGMMSHMGADVDPSVASVPEDEQSDESMALRRSGKMDHRDAADGVMAVTNAGNTGDEETVCDSAAEAEMPTDNLAEAMTGRRTGPGVMVDDTAAVMADNTENPDTADLGQDDTEGVALAYIPGPQRAESQDIPVQSNP